MNWASLSSPFLYMEKGETIWRLQFMTKCIKVVKPQWVH